MQNRLDDTPFTGDIPLPRFGHSMTFYSPSKLCMFGGAVGSSSNMSMTQLSYSLNMETRQWSKIECTGSIPSARAAHGAACVGKNSIVIYGGATKQGLASDQLYYFNIKEEVGIWNVVNVKHKTPGKRYGHTLIFSSGYLIVFGGNLQNKAANDLWVIDITKKPQWCQIKCNGNIPRPRDYHSAALCSVQPAEGMMIIFGGRSDQKQPLSDCWGLVRHNSTGTWQWKEAPNKNKAKLCARYQHTSLFISSLMLVIGGKNNQKQNVPMQIFDIETNQWTSIVTPARMRHVSWYFNKTLFNYGGLCESQPNFIREIQQLNLLQLFAKNQSLIAAIDPLRSSTVSNKSADSGQSTRMLSSVRSASTERIRQSPIFKKDQTLIKVQKTEIVHMRQSTKSDNKITILNPIYGNQKRKLQIKKPLQMKQNIGMFFLSKLMHPKLYSTNPLNVHFEAEQIIALCDMAEQIIASQPMLLKVRAPLKIFGDIHGQFSDLMQFFNLYGTPHSNNQKQKSDVQNFDYIFLGDYVDRGNHSLQTICLLLALKVVYPNQIHLLRGNHQDMGINIQFGFGEECAMKMDEQTDSPHSVYMRINRLFEWLPLAAVAQDKILCVHGGIGKGLNTLSQILQIKRPLQIQKQVVDKQSQIVLDITWSDPTESDQILGIHPNLPRDYRQQSNIVRFGPDRVHSFLKNNNLSMIVRAHEYVMDGFQRFAGGALITVFSATDYCKKHKNAGAILILKTNMEIVPKVIYPKQKSVSTWIGEDDNYTVKRSQTPPRWRTNN